MYAFQILPSSYTDGAFNTVTYWRYAILMEKCLQRNWLIGLQLLRWWHMTRIRSQMLLGGLA